MFQFISIMSFCDAVFFTLKDSCNLYDYQTGWLAYIILCVSLGFMCKLKVNVKIHVNAKVKVHVM